MTIGLQLILAVVAIATAFVILRSIRKSNLQIEESFFWLLLSVILAVFALFPNVIVWISETLSFQSPANFVFLIMIFLLIVNQYRLTKIISKNEVKLKNLIQNIAITDYDRDDKHD